MKKSILLITVILGLSFTSCTDNSRARHWGGSQTINLDKGEKLIEATWKESGLWYLTRPMRENEKAEIFIFREDSQYGIMEGKVIFIETK